MATAEEVVSTVRGLPAATGAQVLDHLTRIADRPVEFGIYATEWGWTNKHPRTSTLASAATLGLLRQLHLTVDVKGKTGRLRRQLSGLGVEVLDRLRGAE